MASSFDLDRFVADCRDAMREDARQVAVREVVARAMANPSAVRRAFPAPTRTDLERLYVAPDLTILNIVWAPHMTFWPHDHRMWAVIGIYDGREDNIFWRRLEDEHGSRVEAAGARALCLGDCCTLGPDIIHSVTNPIPRFTSAIHIYGGDFFNAQRRQWDPESLREEPYDFAAADRLADEYNRRLAG